MENTHPVEYHTLMEYIASGFYYHVYRKSDTRVIKIPTSKLRKAWLLLWWRMTSLTRWWDEVQDIDRWFARELVNTKLLIERIPDKARLGNPSTIAPDGSYTQDYARSIGRSIDSMDEQSWRIAVHAYCEIQHMLWEHALGERIWNFTFNCGINPHTSTLILIDLNEITTEKEVMRSHIRNKRWNVQSSLTFLERNNPEFKKIAQEIIESECTEERLDALWGCKM